MKNKTLILILLMLPVFALNAQRTWTLQECIDTVLENNRNIKQRELIREQNKILYTQAKLDLLPNISATAEHNWSFGRSKNSNDNYQDKNGTSTGFSLSSGLILFDGLKMKYNIDARALELKNSEAELEKIRQDMIMNVSTVFLQVLLDKELLNNANELLELTNQNVAQKQLLVENGKLAQGELLELQAQQSREEMNILQAQHSLEYSLLELAQILELSNFENIDVVVPKDLPERELQLLDPETIYRQALTHRPEVQAAEYQLQGSQTNVNIARSSYYPSVSLNASMGQNFYDWQKAPFSSGMWIRLSMPIFDKMATANQVKQAKIGVESSRIALENSKLEMRKSIQQMCANASAAQARWTAAIKSEQASLEAFRYANQKYENSRATVYELYQAKNNLSRSQSELTQAKYEYAFRLKILELYSK
jgi:Outer membrane protein